MGTEEEKILSQADVDALVALVPDKPRAQGGSVNRLKTEERNKSTAPETIETGTAASGTTLPQMLAPGELEAFQKALTDLTRQVNKLTNAIQRIDLLEAKTEQITKTLGQSSNIHASGTIIKEIQTQLQEVSNNLKNRREIRDIFQCTNCQSKSTVAFYTKCTSCGHEKWFGWWPGKKRS